MPKNLHTFTTTILTAAAIVLFILYFICIHAFDIFASVSDFLLPLGFLGITMLLNLMMQRILFTRILREAQITKESDVRYRYAMQNFFEGILQGFAGITIIVYAVLSVSHFRSTGLSVVLFTLMGLYVLAFLVSLVKEHLLKESEEKVRANMKIRSILLVGIVFMVLVAFMVYPFLRHLSI